MPTRPASVSPPIALRPVGSVCATSGALTSVLLDSGLVTSWEPAFDEPGDDDLGGHPQRVLDLLDADEDFSSAPLGVGKGKKGLVLNLEGVSGEAEVYHLPDGTFVLAEPTLGWWLENFPKQAADVQAMFADAFDPNAKMQKAGSVAVPSGKLAIFDSNADLAPAKKARAAALVRGKVARFGRDGDGLLVGVPRGTCSVRRRVIKAKWTKKYELVVAHLGGPNAGTKKSKVTPATVHLAKLKPATKAAPRAKTAPAAPLPKKRSSVVFAPSAELRAIVGGTTPLTLREVHDKIKEYVDRNKLKDPKSFFTIYPDAKLGKVLGNEPISIYAVSKPVNKHLTRQR